jgi:RHS repeat-associated protein
VKVAKKVSAPEVQDETDYLSGFQYKNGELQFFPTAEGYVNVTDGRKFNYVYNYTDHLGNIRLSYTFDGRENELKILEENHYYPFGLKHSNYNVDKVDFDKDETGIFAMLAPVDRNKNQYKYQGQERQDELGLNWDSFKWRNYDYAIGRFMSIDPLSEKYVHNGVYNFSENRVIDARELEGLEAVKVTDLQNNQVNVTVKVKPVNSTNAYPLTKEQVGTAMGNFKSQTESSFSGKSSDNMNVKVNIVIDPEATLMINFVDVPIDSTISSTSDDAIQIAQADGLIEEKDFGNSQTGTIQVSSLANFKEGKKLGYTGTPGHTASHEFGHIVGLPHLNEDGNLMKDGSRSNERKVTPEQITEMLKNIPEAQ